jgi:hypothetical protein
MPIKRKKLFKRTLIEILELQKMNKGSKKYKYLQNPKIHLISLVMSINN